MDDRNRRVEPYFPELHVHRLGPLGQRDPLRIAFLPRRGHVQLLRARRQAAKCHRRRPNVLAIEKYRCARDVARHRQHGARVDRCRGFRRRRRRRGGGARRRSRSRRPYRRRRLGSRSRRRSVHARGGTRRDADGGGCRLPTQHAEHEHECRHDDGNAHGDQRPLHSIAPRISRITR